MQRLIAIIISALQLFAAYAASYTWKDGKGMVFRWQEGDAVCAYSATGDRIVLKAKETIGDNPAATFSGNGWTMLPGEQYNACSPYSVRHVADGCLATALPVSYSGQRQSGNGSTHHLAAYDHMAARSAWSGGNAAFPFSHLGCVLRLSVTMPEAVVATGLTLSTAGAGGFVVEAAMNAASGSLVPLTMANEISLALEDIAVAAGGELTVYMMLAPRDYSHSRIRLTVTTAEGKSLVAYIAGGRLQAGKAYPVMVGAKGAAMRAKGSASVFPLEPLALSLAAYPAASATDFPVDEECVMEESLGTPGDVDGDGLVTMADANAIVNTYLGSLNGRDALLTADMDGDGVITMADANAIVNAYLAAAAPLAAHAKTAPIYAADREVGVGANSLFFDGSAMRFAWDPDAEIGVFPLTPRPEDASQQPLALLEAESDGGKAVGRFGVGGRKFALHTEDVSEYMAYYPYDRRNEAVPYTALPVSYLGQTQACNASLNTPAETYKQSERDACAHLGAKDYLVAKAVQGSNSGTRFAFSRVGGVMRLCMRVPELIRWDEVKVVNSETNFVTKASIDLAQAGAAAAMTPVEQSKTLSLRLGVDGAGIDFTGHDASSPYYCAEVDGHMLIAYMMMAPVSVATAGKVYLTGYNRSTGRTVQYRGVLSPVDIEAGTIRQWTTLSFDSMDGEDSFAVNPFVAHEQL